MKASFNYTGRKRLDNSTFQINIYEKKEADSELEIVLFKEQIKDLPEGAVSWVEAYHASKMMRFRLGSWDDSNQERFILSEFDPGEPLLFRIKIVDETDQKHPIKGWRDRIRPVIYDVSGRQKKSVLPVKPVDLGHIAWKIDWETDFTHPILLVNSRINDARDVTSIVKNDPDFAILVFPQVIQEVLTRLLLEDVDIDEDEENEWLTFAYRLVNNNCERRPEDKVKDKELVVAWADSVAQAFGREAELISRYVKFKEGT